MTINTDTKNQNSLLETKCSDLLNLTSTKVKEAIEDTANTREKLNATLEKLEKSRSSYTRG